ncbi:MAG: biotin transporter BioY [Ancalomicrobiaceae bacterium]|nr:biotin transporter BioY [Ancalomicrobiaceae bacterium]
MMRSVIAPGLATLDRVWSARTEVERVTRFVVLAAVGTVLLWAAAKVQVPFFPVPATLTTLVVVLIGAFYGSRLGAATILAYLTEGLAGLPVFAGTPEKGIGLAYMVGPTGGYLIGYVAAAFLVGLLVERGWGRSIVAMIGAVFAGNVALYAAGIAWLGYLIGFDKAITYGLVPFLAADALKILIAAAITVAASRRIAR